MTKCKKLLSVVLCIAMLLGTLTTGLMVVSAEGATSMGKDIPAYASLKSTYETVENGEITKHFFYSGLELYLIGKDDDGNPISYTKLESGANIAPGSSLRAKFYVKTDHTLNKGQYVFAIDADNSSAYSISKITQSISNIQAVNTDHSMAKLKSGTTSNVSGYTVEDMTNWKAIMIRDASTSYDRSAATQGDDTPLAEFDINLKADYEGKLSFILFPDTYTAYDGAMHTAGFENLDVDTNAGRKATENFLIQDNQSFTVSNQITFKKLDGSIIKAVSAPVDADVAVPSVSNLFGWADEKGNFVDLTDLKMDAEHKNKTYTAALKSDEINVTLSGNGGKVDGQDSKVISVKYGDGFDPSKYTATKSGDEFHGWSINTAHIEKVYQFTGINPVTAEACWNDNVLTVYIPNADGGLSPLYQEVGGQGEVCTPERAESITNSAFAALAEKGKDVSGLGVDLEPVTVGALGFLSANGDGTYPFVGFRGNNAKRVVFGQTKALILKVQLSLKVSFHYPVFDEEGNWDGETWEDYRLLKADAVASTATDAEAAYSDSDYEDFSDSYKTYLDYSELDGETVDVSLVKTGLYSYVPTTGAPLPEDIYDPNGSFLIDTSRLKTLDQDKNETIKYHYNQSFIDGEGNLYDLQRLATGTGIVIRRSNHSDDFNLFDVYTYPSPKVFRLSVNCVTSKTDTSNNDYIVTKEFHYGDTVTEADLTELFTGNLDSDKFELSELKKDGAKVRLAGYSLKEIWYGETNLTEGGSFEIDSSNYDKTKPVQGINVISVTGVFEARSFKVTVKYKNAAGKEVNLVEKIFKGNESIEYASLITSELEAKVNADCPEGMMIDTNGLVDAKGNSYNKVSAYECPSVLYIKYTTDHRTAFIDFANGKPEEGRGYLQRSLYYGTKLYREDFDPDSTEYGEDDYWYNKYLISGQSTFSTRPKKVPVLDDDGNPTYEPKYEPMLDEEGNPVLDDAGEPKMQVMTDKETGAVIYDTDKPILKDPKGETVQRPYRNCEFMGTKAYHLDYPVFSWADMPAESEWIEGYENEECEIHNTDILQLQWKPDSDFLFRVYNTDGVGLQLSISPFSISVDTNGCLYSALGKDFRWYYWDVNGKPCQRGGGMLNTKPEEQVIILLLPESEKIEIPVDATSEQDEEATPEVKTSTSWYFTAFPLGRDFLKPSLIPTLLPTILKAVRGLIN